MIDWWNWLTATTRKLVKNVKNTGYLFVHVFTHFNMKNLNAVNVAASRPFSWQHFDLCYSRESKNETYFINNCSAPSRFPVSYDNELVCTMHNTKALEVAHLNIMQLYLMLSVTPVFFPAMLCQDVCRDKGQLVLEAT